MLTPVAFVTAAALAFAGITTAYPTDNTTTTTLPYPDIADTTYASPDLVDFLHKFFTAKTLANLDTLQSLFTPTENGVYYDAVMGLSIPQANLSAVYKQLYGDAQPGGASYPLQVIGDMNSAVIRFVDTPEMFGTEVRGISAVDFLNGKVLRWIDYWDARHDPLILERGPMPATFGEELVTAAPNKFMECIVTKLNSALATQNSTAVAELFTFNAVFEDRVLRTRIEGQVNIESYLSRALPTLPYGSGVQIRHVVGTAHGGAYEWIAKPGGATPSGISRIELDSTGLISGFASLWDSSLTTNATLEALTGLVTNL
ncbi:hypothetical protein GQ53DRAFT_756359 [Thozetella sp. PMI_491]|nr:hypothetical protein GQ53DRAFT_756359 [Thozetella sp. PMI_491]